MKQSTFLIVLLLIILTFNFMPKLINDDYNRLLIQTVLLVVLLLATPLIILYKSSKGEVVNYKRLFFITYLGLLVTMFLYLQPNLKYLISY